MWRTFSFVLPWKVTCPCPCFSPASALMHRCVRGFTFLRFVVLCSIRLLSTHFSTGIFEVEPPVIASVNHHYFPPPPEHGSPPRACCSTPAVKWVHIALSPPDVMEIHVGLWSSLLDLAAFVQRLSALRWMLVKQWYAISTLNAPRRHVGGVFNQCHFGHMSIKEIGYRWLLFSFLTRRNVSLCIIKLRCLLLRTICQFFRHL